MFPHLLVNLAGDAFLGSKVGEIPPGDVKHVGVNWDGARLVEGHEEDAVSNLKKGLMKNVKTENETRRLLSAPWVRRQRVASAQPLPPAVACRANLAARWRHPRTLTY